MYNLIASYVPILLIMIISFFLSSFLHLQDKNKIINHFLKVRVFLSGGFFYFFIFLYYYDNLNLVIFIFMTLMFLVGILDDRFDLKISLRFLSTFSLILIFLILDNTYITYFNFLSSPNLILNTILTITFLLGFLHMTNMSDGKNGHLMTYVLFILYFSLYKIGFDEIDYFIFILLSSSIFFLLLNLLNLCQLGNSGVIILSLIIYFIIKDNYDLNYMSEIDIFVLFSFLIFDGIRVSFLRIKNKKSPFSKDLLHMHFLFKKWYLGYFVIFFNYSLLLLIFINIDLKFYIDFLLCLFFYINVLFLSKLLNNNNFFNLKL